MLWEDLVLPLYALVIPVTLFPVIPVYPISSLSTWITSVDEEGTVNPVVDVKVTLFDGSFHDVDSSEVAFKVAGSQAFKEGAKQAKPVILEPVMSVEAVTPKDYLGDVTGDLNRRRGIVLGMEDTVMGNIVKAEVPLSEMFGYSTSLRSMSQGRATYTMEFTKYAELPSSVAEALIQQAS